MASVFEGEINSQQTLEESPKVDGMLIEMTNAEYTTFCEILSLVHFSHPPENGLQERHQQLRRDLLPKALLSRVFRY